MSHQSVHDIWVDYNKPLEGIVYGPYADVLGLVTTAMGNLIDPIATALALNWQLSDGSPADHAAIVAAWNAVKNDPNCAKFGWTYALAKPENNIRLSTVDAFDLIYRKFAANDTTMAKRFGDWESRPADAQLAAHSMAWAMGPGFWGKFPKFTAAFTREDYATAANECTISPAHGTIVLRNQRNKQCLLDAAHIAADPNADRSVLCWTP